MGVLQLAQILLLAAAQIEKLVGDRRSQQQEGERPVEKGVLDFDKNKNAFLCTLPVYKCRPDSVILGSNCLLLEPVFVIRG